MKSLGSITTEVRDLQDFHRIEIEGRVNVHLVQDSSNYAEVTFGEVVLDGITTEIIDSTLHIREENRCDWVRSQDVIPELEVHYQMVSSIQNEGSGYIQFDNSNTATTLTYEVHGTAGNAMIDFTGDELVVAMHSGSSDVTVKGVAREAYYYSAGYGPLDASQLEARIVSVHSAGTGDVSVRAWSTVYYQLFDWADILVYGNPEVVRWHHEGSGEVIPSGD